VLVREMLAVRYTPVTAPRVSAPRGWLRGVRVRLSVPVGEVLEHASEANLV
jgi:hypothetical protein